MKPLTLHWLYFICFRSTEDSFNETSASALAGLHLFQEHLRFILWNLFPCIGYTTSVSEALKNHLMIRVPLHWLYFICFRGNEESFNECVCPCIGSTSSVSGALKIHFMKPLPLHRLYNFSFRGFEKSFIDTSAPALAGLHLFQRLWKII